MFGSDSIHIHIGAMDQDMLISRTDLAVLIDSGIVYPKSKSVLKKKFKRLRSSSTFIASKKNAPMHQC